jgi:hypothetical protein
MDQILAFYKNMLKAFAVGVALTAAFLHVKAVPLLAATFGGDHWSLKVVPILNSHISLVIALGASEWFIRKHLWRWFHAELDFSGQWEGTSEYTRIYLANNPLPKPVRHQVTIKQDCLCFKIIPSPDPDEKMMGYWESKAINLVNADQLVYAYEIHYGGRPDFPEIAFGFEDMRTVQRDSKERPCVLRGAFYQCVIGREPVYSGSVEFRRVGKALKPKDRVETIGPDRKTSEQPS